MTTELFNSIRESYNNNKLVVFIGAGISCAQPSYIPHATKLKTIILNAIAEQLDYKGKALSQVDNIGLENLISIIHGCRPGFIDNFMDIVTRCTAPNWMHKAIKLISQKSNITLTTNFDCLLENAFVIGHQGYTVLLNAQSLESSITAKPNVPFLVKLHGSSDSVDKDALGITLQAVGKSSINNQNALGLSYLSDYDILFLGYRGRDIDVMLPLSEGEGKAYWCWHAPDTDEINLITTPNNDNPTVDYYCRTKNAHSFKANTQQFLHRLVDELNLEPPSRSSSTGDSSFFESELTLLVKSFTESQKLNIWSRVLAQLGMLHESNEMIDKMSETFNNSRKLSNLILKAENLKFMNSKESFRRCNETLGLIEYEIEKLSSVIEKNTATLNLNKIKAYTLLYNNQIDPAVALLRQSIEICRASFDIESNTEALELLIALKMELGNCYYYQSIDPGDRHNGKIHDACIEYIEAFKSSLNNSNILLQAKLLENIAQVYNKWIYSKALDNPDILNMLKYGISCRAISLFYLEFIGNDSALGRANLNIGYDYSRTKAFDASFLYANKRLSQSIQNNDFYGMAAALEIMGDSSLDDKRELALELYNSSKHCYQKASEHPELDLENIDYKIEHGYASFNHTIRDYYDDTPSLQHLLEWMDDVLAI